MDFSDRPLLVSSICIEPIDEPEFEQNLLEIITPLHKQTILLFIQAHQHFLECNKDMILDFREYSPNGFDVNKKSFKLVIYIPDPHLYPDYCAVLVDELNKLGDVKDLKQWLNVLDKWTDEIR